jgi:predicted dehydrogenase
VLGAGYFARFHYDAWSRIDGVALVAAADRLEAKAAEMAALHRVPAVFTDLETMLDQARPDVVDLVVQPPAHLAAIRAAAARGVAIICQKPFCGTIGEAREAVAVAAAAGVPLIVHENFRFQPWHREIKRLLAAGAVGSPYQATFRLRPGDGQGPRAYLDRQPYFQKMERFLVHETAIHLIDVFRFLLGEVRTVYADLRRLNPVIAGEDAGYILLEHEGGTRALFDGNRLSSHAAENRRLVIGELSLEGSDGVLDLDGDGRLHLRAHQSNERRRLAHAWPSAGFAGDSVHALQQAIVAHLRHGEPIANTGREYLANLAIEEAVYASASAGRRIAIATA